MSGLYYNRKMNQYFWNGSSICSNCKDELDGFAVHMIRHPKNKPTYDAVWCSNCLRFAKKQCEDYLRAVELREVLVLEQPPDGSILIPIKRIRLTTSTNVVDSVDNPRLIKSDDSCCEVKDHTVLAGRESLEGLQIGQDPENIPLKNSLLDSDETLQILTAKPIVELISAEEKKQLDVDK